MIRRVLLAISLLISTLVAEDLHEIRLLRPVKAGDRFEISAKVAIRGFHSVVMSVRDVEEQERFFVEGLGFKKVATISEPTIGHEYAVMVREG